MHMATAPLLDWKGFGVMYPLAFASTLAALTTLYQYVNQNEIVQRNTALKKHASDLGSSANESVHNSDSPNIPFTTICRLLVGTLYGATFLFAMFTLAQGQAGRYTEHDARVASVLVGLF